MRHTKKNKHDLYIGITTWNSELFLEHCLKSVKETTQDISIAIGVIDNVSTDRSVEIALDYGADVKIEHCSQSIALNRLLSKSTGTNTLLIHSDVVLISPHWYRLCTQHLNNHCCLVSPEDIGCGPMTRPYGANMPESCFLLFDTKNVMKARTIIWRKRKGIPVPEKHLNLEHYYVTHHLPEILSRKNLSWKAMNVHCSPAADKPLYRPTFTPEYWSQELSYLRYGMGNFYSLDGEIIHYHNWYDRVPKDVPMDSTETTDGNGKGLPLGFLSAGTNRFLKDLEDGNLVLPDNLEYEAHVVPKTVSRHEPNLTVPFQDTIADS